MIIIIILSLISLYRLGNGTSAQTNAYYTIEAMQLRTVAKAGARSLGTIEKGALVQVFGSISEEFCYVKFASHEGYLLSSNLKPVKANSILQVHGTETIYSAHPKNRGSMKFMLIPDAVVYYRDLVSDGWCAVGWQDIIRIHMVRVFTCSGLGKRPITAVTIEAERFAWQ
ncbi:MAG: hypothetical protein FWE76_04665 [Symbiobacteriaceae bacterium]|nr:hypothetical protein [Symbiobacteriaceae bacterium]